MGLWVPWEVGQPMSLSQAAASAACQMANKFSWQLKSFNLDISSDPRHPEEGIPGYEFMQGRNTFGISNSTLADQQS